MITTQSQWLEADWIQTYSGLRFYPARPTPEMITIGDIAQALSLEPRFAGQSLFHYSVAQHSILVSLHCDPADALWGLLHDASEAYLKDIPRPIKRMLPGYKRLERRVQRVIAKRFGLPWPCPESVHVADTRILVNERRDVMGPLQGRTSLRRGDLPPLPGVAIAPNSDHCFVRGNFLNRFRELVAQGNDNG